MFRKCANKRVIIQRKKYNFFVKNIWKFVSSKELDLWHEKIEKFLPEYILDSKYTEIADYMTKRNFNSLLEIYLNQPKYLIEMIENTIWVGISNLYGGTGNYSQTSLNSLEIVIKLGQENNISFPEIELVSFSKFSENNGWGNTVLSPFEFGSKLP